MGISFHCEYCGKKIEAPDTAGGKWGKCPACRNKVYVPANNPPDDMLRLAPIDTEEELYRGLWGLRPLRVRRCDHVRGGSVSSR